MHDLSKFLIVYQQDTDTELLPNKKSPARCVDCGQEVYSGSQRCKPCLAKHRIKNTKCKYPDVETLRGMVAKEGYEAVGRRYNVSGNAIKKFISKRSNITV